MISSRRSSTARRVELAGHRLADARDAPHLGEQLARAQQRLGRHAGVERALAADQVRLDDRDVEARLAQPARRHLAGGAGAEDDHVEFALAHGGKLSQLRDPLQRRYAERKVGSATVYFSASGR